MSNCSKCSKQIPIDSFFCHYCESYVVDPTLGEKAPFFRRWVALVLDPLGFIICIFMMMGTTATGMTGGPFGGIFVLLGPALGFAYFILFMRMLSRGLTPGKWVLGLRVVDARSGAMPGFGTMFLREVIGRFISGLFFSLGYLWALFDRSGQAWHDKVAKTLVLREDAALNSGRLKIAGLTFSGMLAPMIAGMAVSGSGASNLAPNRAVASQPKNSGYDSAASTNLMRAAFANDVIQAKQALQDGADPNAENQGWTALMYCIHNKSPAMCDTLMRAGADINKKGASNQTALEFAQKMNQVQLLTSNK